MTHSEPDSSNRHAYGLLDSIMSNPALRDRLEKMPTDEKTVTLTMPDAADLDHPGLNGDSKRHDLSETIAPKSEPIQPVDPGFVPTRHITDLGDEILDHVDYRIIGQLGRGGTGVVYQAHQRAVDREVAIKVLRDDVSQSELSRTRFLTEARVIGGLDHPNVISIHELSTDQQGRLFYSMKRIDGTSWDQRIDEISESENLDILLRVSNAIQYAHSRGLIHRDIKPENVMLGQFGEVLLADWGLAISHGAEENAIAIGMTIGGTPAYMAPELASGDQHKIGYASDIYLLGAVLFQILTGETPHHGVSLLHCIRAAAENEIRQTDVTGELMDIAMKAMETDPAKRFGSVAEFTEAIRDQRQHDQSSRLVRRARERLERASEANQYEDFRVADAILREALDVWPDNQRAVQLSGELQQRFARMATEQGDLDLALSILQAAGLGESGDAKQVIEAIREREARQQRVSRFSALFTESPEAGLLLRMPGGWVVEANRAFSNLFGYDTDQIVGHQIGELNLWASPERRLELVASVEKHGVIENFEATFLDIDANEIEVLLSSRLVEVDGEAMVVSTIRDVSLLKQAELELKESQKQLRQIQRLAGMASWRYDVQSEMVTWSEEVFGLVGRTKSEGAPTGDEFMELVHPDDREPLQETIDTILPSGAASELMVRMRTPSGVYRRLLFRGKPVFGDDGEMIEVYGVMIPQK